MKCFTLLEVDKITETVDDIGFLYILLTLGHSVPVILSTASKLLISNNSHAFYKQTNYFFFLSFWAFSLKN